MFKIFTRARKGRPKRNAGFVGLKKHNSFKRVMSNNKTTPLEALNANAVDMEQTRAASFAVIAVVIMMIAIGSIIVGLYKVNAGWFAVGGGILLGMSMLNVVLSTQIQGSNFECLQVNKNLLHDPYFPRNLNDFPADPVLQRAATFLVPHGQDDCDFCREMREEENKKYAADPPSAVMDEHFFDHSEDELSYYGGTTPLYFPSMRNSPIEGSRTPIIVRTTARSSPQDGTRTPNPFRTPTHSFKGSQYGLDSRKSDRRDAKTKVTTKLRLSTAK